MAEGVTHDWEEDVGGRLRWMAEDEASMDMLGEGCRGACGDEEKSTGRESALWKRFLNGKRRRSQREF
jgi:hypothetical protein